jgi:uncharacterized protein (TIGR02246 family)
MNEIDEKLRIYELSYRYAAAVDRRDFDSFVMLFTADGLLLSDDFTLQGRENIRQTIQNITEFKLTQHHVHNMIVDIQGDSAKGEVYCVANHLYEKEDETRKLDWGIRYHDEYVKEESGWLIKQRKLVVDWQQDLPLKG